MGRSLGLAAYRALSRRSGKKRFDPAAIRDAEELVWIHAAGRDNRLAILDLAARIAAERDGVTVLITVPDQEALFSFRKNISSSDRIISDAVPSEHPDAVAEFIRHYSPDTGIWSWGQIRPNLISAAHEAGCPMMLIDADAEGFDGRRDRWLPDLSRALLSDFKALLAQSPAALRSLTDLGIPAERVEVTAPLQAGGLALPCDDTDLSDLSACLSGRPVWLAAGVQQGEADAVFQAHRQALRLSHRLLLVLHPGDISLASDFSRRAAKESMVLKKWSDGEEPDDSTQVLLADDDADLGLFYRIAPVSFLGSSLAPGFGGRNPFDAAALGSAVLYGPNVRLFLPFYTRLATAGAARIVNDADSLGTAITRLIAPDQAATMAHAGWDVVSEGAALTDRVIELVTGTLDDREEQRHART